MGRKIEGKREAIDPKGSGGRSQADTYEAQ
jgi:hypothetical protein